MTYFLDGDIENIVFSSAQNYLGPKVTLEFIYN